MPELRPKSVGFPGAPRSPVRTSILAVGRGQLGPMPVIWTFPVGSMVVFTPGKVELFGRSSLKSPIR